MYRKKGAFANRRKGRCFFSIHFEPLITNTNQSVTQPYDQHAVRIMENNNGRQTRLLARLFSRLRGDHHKYKFSNINLDKKPSTPSTGISESTGFDSTPNEEEDEFETHAGTTTSAVSDDEEFPDNTSDLRSELDKQISSNGLIDKRLKSFEDRLRLIIDFGRKSLKIVLSGDVVKFAQDFVFETVQTSLKMADYMTLLQDNVRNKYGGQYLTPEQLPEFCDQLHHLVEMIRNIQTYAKVTGEYPSALERRLEQEALEVAALAAEARNARDVVARTRLQRRAVRAQRRHLVAHLTCLKETEIRELESIVRLSDRKLYKSWEGLKDSTDPTVFEPLLEEIRNKQSGLESLVRLVESRRSALLRPQPHPLPPPHHNEESPSTRRRTEGIASRRATLTGKRRRRERDGNREPRSVPLSNDPSQHRSQANSNGPESTSRYRVGSAGAVALTPIELPSRGSVRDILFFSAH